MNIESLSIILDILLTSLIVYAVYYFFRRTQTAAILKGILFFLCFYVITSWFHLNTIHWLLMQFVNNFSIILVIIFHQEIRQFFSNLGRTADNSEASEHFSTLLASSLQQLSEQQIGALIVVEKTMKLNDLLHTGIILNARFSVELILSIFYKSTMLHDGAVIIRNENILAAKVFLPAVFRSPITGTRHGSAMSISEERDCIVFVVSEETGTISYAKNGVLTPIPEILLEEVVHEIIS